MLNKVENLVKEYKIKYSISINNIIQYFDQSIESIVVKDLFEKVISTILQYFLINKIKKILQQNYNCSRKL